MHDEKVKRKMDVFVWPGLLLPWGQSESVRLPRRERAWVISQGRGSNKGSGIPAPDNVPVVKSPFVTVMKITEMKSGFLKRK